LVKYREDLMQRAARLGFGDNLIIVRTGPAIRSFLPGGRGLVARALSLALVIFLCSGWLRAQEKIRFQPVRKFAIFGSSLQITQTANPKRTFTVTGERAGIFGHQDGSFEEWTFPIKVIDRFQISARVEGLDEPIEMNKQAVQVSVYPDHTTITYSNAAIVIKQYMFAVRGDSVEKVGAIVVFEISAARRSVITFSFRPVMIPAWPAPSTGAPKASWIDVGNGGGYFLTTANPSLFGIVAMSGAGRPTYPAAASGSSPLEFAVEFDPRRHTNLLFPLLMTASYNAGDLTSEAALNLEREIAKANDRVPELYTATHDYYANFFKDKMTIDTPDSAVNDAFRWAELAINQMRLKLGNEAGLAAGWAASGESARPGYGWFFGRDTLWSLFAIDSYGDFKLAREALDFLIVRQRSDGKIMHEFSQTSKDVDWAAMPYFYAEADSTPLFIMAMTDYARSSGDLAFIRAHWESVKRAYAFMREHDSSGDGLYDNSQGTGWVEDWPGQLPHQELYLVALEQQSMEAMSYLANWMGDAELALSAAARAKFIAEKAREYRQAEGFYAFSKNTDGGYDATQTIFPSVAWWTGHGSLPNAEAMLQQWNSSQFATDWGLRSVSSSSKIYDPLSYHHGSVWPLFTGWASMAEYRASRPLAGYQQLMSNVNLTWLESPGAIPELLSGEFDEPLDQSTWHQLWSSAMVVSPLMRGMLGIEVDAANRYLSVKPELPASWNQVTIHNVPFGDGRLELVMRRAGSRMKIDAISKGGQAVCLVDGNDTQQLEKRVQTKCTQAKSVHHRMEISLPSVEVAAPAEQPRPGSTSQGMKIVDEVHFPRQISLVLEAPAGTTQSLSLRFNGNKRKISVTGAALDGQALQVSFPPGEGYKTQRVQVSW
jgi:glycogen debranching enzyme